MPKTEEVTRASPLTNGMTHFRCGWHSKQRQKLFSCYKTLWSVVSSFLELPSEKSLRPDADSETKECQDLFITLTGHNSVVIESP